MDFNLNIDLGTIETQGQAPVKLTRSERSVLKLLTANPHRVITRDQLLNAVSEPGSDKSDRNIDFLINRLRRKLVDDARQPRFIATRYGEGYVWIAEAPLSLQQIGEADAVIGPVHGLDLIAEHEATGNIVQEIASALTDAFGDDKKVAYAPECPPPDQFGTTAPGYAAEITFFSDRARTDCIIAVKRFRSRQIIFARRVGLKQITTSSAVIGALSTDIQNAVWQAEIKSPSEAEPLPVKLFRASGTNDAPRQVSDSASPFTLLTTHREEERRSLSHWLENDRRLRTLLEQSPEDPELKLLIALNTHSKYVTSGAKLFARGHNMRQAEEDEIEDYVTTALPSLRNDPEHAIVAAKLLHFVKRGYDDLARDVCEGSYAESVTVGQSLAIIGQMRAFFGETDAALQCLDQALNLARTGSHAHLYALVLKCQALAAAARWDALETTRRELSSANKIAGFVLEPLFCNPDAPSIRARALAFLLTREKAQAMLMHSHYVSARLFQNSEQGANSIRSLARVMTSRFGPEVIPDEVRFAFPELLPD